jgi:hypothetical protein
MPSSTTVRSYQIAGLCSGDGLVAGAGGSDLARIPFRASPHAFLARQCKNPRLSGGGFWLREPDDYLLSHGNPHYHRRRVVSRSCSGWEGVGPTRYGHQAKGVVLLASPTEPIWEEAVILSCVYHTRESNMSLWIAASAFTRRRSTRQTCYRIKPYGQLVSVS